MLLYQDHVLSRGGCSRRARQSGAATQTKIGGLGPDSLRMPHGSLRTQESQTGLAQGLGAAQMQCDPTRPASFPFLQVITVWFSHLCLAQPPPTPCPAPLAHQLHYRLARSSYPSPAIPGKLTVGQAGHEQQQQEEPQECLHRGEAPGPQEGTVGGGGAEVSGGHLGLFIPTGRLQRLFLSAELELEGDALKAFIFPGPDWIL